MGLLVGSGSLLTLATIALIYQHEVSNFRISATCENNFCANTLFRNQHIPTSERTAPLSQDSTGVSNLFVLDLCDTANTQDPRDGRTSLMTAVIDNNEVREQLTKETEK